MVRVIRIGRMVAQLIQAAAPGTPDTVDRDAQPGTDLGRRHGRVFGQHEDQLLTGRRQPGERFAQRSVLLGDKQLMLGDEQLMLGDSVLLVRESFGIEELPRTRHSVRGMQGSPAFPHGGGSQPARKGAWRGKPVKLVGHLEPDGPADVAGLRVGQLVPAADRPHQGGVALDERVPSLLVAVPCACHQVSD